MIFYVKINFTHRITISQFLRACSHYDVIVRSCINGSLILVSMERGCPYLYTGSKFRVLRPSVLIIRGGCNNPLHKICLEKRFQRISFVKKNVSKSGHK